MGWWCDRCQTEHDVTACPRGAGSESPPKPCSPMQLRSEREITLAHHAACTCGGAGPGEGCPACEMWHYLFPACR